MHAPVFHRSNLSVHPEILKHFNLYKVDGLADGDRKDFDALNVLHARYLKKHKIIDLSLYPDAIYNGDPLYVIRGKDASDPVAVFQVKQVIAAVFTIPLFKYGHRILSDM